ncbi:MAG: ABC transporter ATP-binding protein [Clostridiales bacterium]|nr:ABC transporter ATP-binding protein [Clostridiales bacterium]
MLKLFKYLKSIDYVFIVICAGLVVAQVYFDLTMPDYTQKLVKEVVRLDGTVDMSAVWRNGGWMLLYAFCSALCSIICGFFAARTAANFAKTLRKELFERVTSFSAAEINKFGTPSLITRTTNDVVQMQNFIAIGLQLLIKAPVLAVWAICKISATAVEWTIATGVVVAIIVAVVAVLMIMCFPRFRQIQKFIDEMNNSVRENVTGVRVVRAFNAEQYQTAKFETVNEKIKRNQLFTSRSLGFMMPVMTVCLNGLTLAVYWIGAALINSTPLVGKEDMFTSMTVFTQYAMQVVMAFMLLIMIFMILPRCVVSARRIAETLGTHRSIRSGSVKKVEHKDGVPVLEFKGVDFAYDHGSNKVVSDISFTVNRGETVAFIGATGSGKTTVINLIERFYDVDGGEVLFNGVNVKDYDEEVLRNSISLAPQRAVLFKGDIRGNVAYGEQTEPDDARINRALDIACAAEFVNGLEQGIASPVAQDGTNFSGGQKQRLSIARAVYKNAELMVFDDTFSALDYKTDLAVRKNIAENIEDATVVLVAQRIGTIMHADKIIVLDEGRIVGMGTHKDLLENCAVYKEIALSQLSKEEL